MKALSLALSMVMLLWTAPLYAGNYALQIILPRLVGTTPDAGRAVLQSDHRTLYAYPSIQYRMRAYVIGGDFTYTYSLTNAPGDMTVDSTGLITWTAPASGTSGTVTLNVRDNLGATTTSDFVVTVDATKFKFIDSEAPGGGSGTLASPYNSLLPLRDGTVGTGFTIYFRGRSTSYTLQDMNSFLVGGGLGQEYFRRVDFNPLRSKQWIAYPGDSMPKLDLGGPIEDFSVNTTTDQLTVGDYGDVYATGQWTFLSTNGTLPTVGGVALSSTTLYYLIRIDATHLKLADTFAHANAGIALDFDGAGTGTHFISHPFIRWSTASSGHATYLEGFEVKNVPNKGFNLEYNAHYSVFQDNYFHDQYGGPQSSPTVGGKNAGFIERESGGSSSLPTDPRSDYVSVQFNTFEDWTGGSAEKVYSVTKGLWANNTFRNGSILTVGTTNLPEGIALKGGYILQPTVRQNTFENIQERALNGNMHIVVGGEFLYNLIKADNQGECLQINQDGFVDTPMYYQRNTILCRIGIRFETGDGPFHFDNNVIVNTDNAASPVNYFYSRAGTPNASQIIQSGNVKGVTADGIVDSSGNLQGAYLSLLGSVGYQLAGSTAPRFSPFNLRR